MIKLLTYDVYRSGMTLFKDLADQTYQDIVHLPSYSLRKVASAYVPTGYDSAYRLIKQVYGQEDVVMGDTIGIIGMEGKAIIMCYIVGSTPYASDWLSDEDSGPALIPTPDLLYFVQTPGVYENTLCRFDETNSVYIPCISAEVGHGITESYIVTGSTPLSSGWLSKTVGGTALTPVSGAYYLVLTSGDYYNNLYRFDGTNYVIVNNVHSSDIISAYIVGSTEFASDWLSLTAAGSALTPEEGKLYLILTSGDYQNFLFRYDSTSHTYVQCSGAGGGVGGVQLSYIVGSTPYASGWLSDEVSGTALTPEQGILYLILTDGQYKNKLYYYNGTNYVPCSANGGIQKAYVVGSTPYASDWLSVTPSGAALTPEADVYYLIMTAGKYANQIVRYDSTLTSYVQVVGGGGGIQLSYIVGATPYAANWLSDEAAGTAITPETDRLYLVVTSGIYQNILYRFDSTSNVYVEVAECIIDSLAEAFDLTQPYSEGDYVSYGKNVYQFDQDHAANDPWDLTEVHEVTVFGEMPEKLEDGDVDDILDAFYACFPYEPTANPPMVLAENSRWLRFDSANKKGILIKAGTNLLQPDRRYKRFTVDTRINLSTEVLTAGTDYFLFLNNDGEIHAVDNKANGQGNYIGRFHTLCTNAGTLTMKIPTSPSSGISVGDTYHVKSYTVDADPDFYAFYSKSVTAITIGTDCDILTVTHPLSGFAAGDILPESIFSLTFKPQTLIEDAMVYDVNTDSCIDIYLQSGTGINTKSKYNQNHTINRPQVLHEMDMNSVGKFLPSNVQFTSAALGSNNGTNIASSIDANTVGGHSDTDSIRMISAIGCEECCGYLWQFLSDIGPAGGSGWHDTIPSEDEFGKNFGDTLCLLAGGGYDSSTSCGVLSRASNLSRSQDVIEDAGARGAAKLFNGQLRCESKNGSAGGGADNSYSYTERAVGTWVDGSTLYERTITGTTINDVSGEISTGLTGVTFCGLESFFVSSGTYWRNLLDSVGVTLDGTKIAMVANDDSAFRNKPFFAKLVYTKS